MAKELPYTAKMRAEIEILDALSRDSKLYGFYLREHPRIMSELKGEGLIERTRKGATLTSKGSNALETYKKRHSTLYKRVTGE